jgi:hypothetical protein
MSTHVVTGFKAQAGRADEVVAILSHILPESLEHDGCEVISLRRGQGDHAHRVVHPVGHPPPLRRIPRLAHRGRPHRRDRRTTTEYLRQSRQLLPGGGGSSRAEHEPGMVPTSRLAADLQDATVSLVIPVATFAALVRGHSDVPDDVAITGDRQLGECWSR